MAVDHKSYELTVSLGGKHHIIPVDTTSNATTLATQFCTLHKLPDSSIETIQSNILKCSQHKANITLSLDSHQDDNDIEDEGTSIKSANVSKIHFSIPHNFIESSPH